MSGCGFCDEGLSDMRCTCDDDPDTERFSLPDLTPADLRTALRLLAAVRAAPQGFAWWAWPEPGGDPNVYVQTDRGPGSMGPQQAPTLDDALDALLGELNAGIEWPSDEQARVFCAQLNAAEYEALDVLRGSFAAEPLMVLKVLGGGE